MAGVNESDERSDVIELTLRVISGTRKVAILDELFRDVHGFNELQRSLRGITATSLSRRLKELERDRIVAKVTGRGGAARRSEYRLTPLGKSLRTVLEVMHRWGRRYRAKVG